MRRSRNPIAVILAICGLSYSFSPSAHGEQKSAQPAVDDMPHQATFAMAHEALVHSKQCFYLSLTISLRDAANQICDKEPLGTKQKRGCTTKAQSSRLANDRHEAALASLSCARDVNESYASLVASVASAVIQGDPDAEICYIEGRVGIKNSMEQEHYIKTAQVLMKKAFVRGDWRIVQLYTATPYFSRTSLANPMIYLPGYGTGFSAYKSERLLYLGSTGNYRSDLASGLRQLSKDLPEQEIAAADAWAADSYAKIFSKSPSLATAPTPCIAEPGSE